MIKQTIARLLEAEMDRKDFLKILGIGAIAATGVTQLVKNVSHSVDSSKSGRVVSSYGSAVYGGKATK